MPKLTQDQRALGMDQVEAVLMAGKWSRSAQREIAKLHGVNRRTVQVWRARVEQQWRDAIKTASIEDERAGWLARCRVGQNVALQRGDTRAYTALLAIESRVLGIEAPARVHLSGGIDVTARPAAALTDDELRAKIEAAREAKAVAAGRVLHLREVRPGECEPED